MQLIYHLYTHNIMKLKILIILLAFPFYSYAFQPIKWASSNPTIEAFPGLNTVNNFNQNIGFWSAGSYTALGVSSHLENLPLRIVKTETSGLTNGLAYYGDTSIWNFDGYLTQPLNQFNITTPSIKLYKLNNQIAIGFVVFIRSFNSQYAADASIPISYNIPETYAKVLAINAIPIKIGDIPLQDQFKPYVFNKTINGVLKFSGNGSVITSPPITFNVNINLLPQVCNVTFDSNKIDFGTITDSELSTGRIIKQLNLQSSCDNIYINNVDMKIQNLNNGMIFSNDKSIGFRLTDKNNNPLTNNQTLSSNVDNYEINITPFKNNDKLYGNHNASLNLMFTYK
ncbi:fimbrial protein [Photobacterium leiognathi]|nr:fimbrial protein [Photobacterium leiognathi]